MTSKLKGSSPRNRKRLNRFLVHLFGMTFGNGVRSNPPRLNIPPEYIVDPTKAIPGTFSAKKRQAVEELREAYAYAMRSMLPKEPIDSPEIMAEYLYPIMSPLSVEQVLVLPVNTRMKPKGEPVIVSRGDVDGSEAGPRLIFRAVIAADARSFFMAHNHPTGDPEPSAGDLQITKRLAESGRLLDCPLNDHIIIGEAGRFYSLRRHNPRLFFN